MKQVTLLHSTWKGYYRGSKLSKSEGKEDTKELIPKSEEIDE